jgi:carbon-monoxide dehydrogenase iron sulfur subunit
MTSMQTVFINPERCIGCRQCEFACAVAHSESKDPALAFAEEPVPKSRIHVSPERAYNMSVPSCCRHCDPAPCAQVCPYAQANGMPARVVATKCDGCIERLDNGQEPACVEACKVDALLFGDLNTLIATDRLDVSDAVIAAMKSQAPVDKPPATVTGWRVWGESAAHIREEI